MKGIVEQSSFFSTLKVNDVQEFFQENEPLMIADPDAAYDVLCHMIIIRCSLALTPCGRHGFSVAYFQLLNHYRMCVIFFFFLWISDELRNILIRDFNGFFVAEELSNFSLDFQNLM